MKTYPTFLSALFGAFLLFSGTAFAQTATHTATVYFETAQSSLSAEARQTLEQTASQYAKATGDARLRISGYTDASGSSATNLALSERRAQAVQRALLALKVPAERIDLVFLGENQPVASNDDPEGRRQNRRALVEVLSGTPAVIGATTPKSSVTFDEPPPPLPVSSVKPVNVNVLVKDDSTQLTIASASVNYETNSHLDSVKTNAKGRVSLRVVPSSPLVLTVLVPGYFLKSETVRAPVEGQEIVVAVVRIPEKGGTAALENLSFLAMDTVLEEASKPVLPNVLQFMRLNPKLKVEIGGHVSIHRNQTMTPDLWSLSENRAKVIYDYLLQNGIPASRMSYKGYGNTQMLFPEILTLEEDMMNRRVEIRVLDK
ncbi:MAG: OmpA family protein [Saprospiraceae bacterium]|nr:OmpA family protein [Saprospiraceae bacterium]